ncbi:hypothetical protein PS15m_006259 [Mucor circinelloides]
MTTDLLIHETVNQTVASSIIKVSGSCKAEQKPTSTTIAPKCSMANVRQTSIFGSPIQAAKCKGFQKEFAKQHACLKCNSESINDYCFICDRRVTPQK